MAATPFLKGASTNVAEALLQEFTQEAAITRRVLERVPSDRLTWKPHPKSMTIGGLALHVAMGPGVFIGWTAVAAVDLPDAERPQPHSLGDIIGAHEHSVEVVRNTLAGRGEAALQGTCTIRKHGATFMTMPRLVIVRTLVMNHWIHHRGQLSVYLRLLNVPVPSMYGPSADESPFTNV